VLDVQPVIKSVVRPADAKVAVVKKDLLFINNVVCFGKIASH
jgi:hypothetical protein